jgi:hypothetical protein
MRNEIRRRLANEGVTTTEELVKELETYLQAQIKAAAHRLAARLRELEGCPLCNDEGAIEIDIAEFPDKAKTVRYPCACTTKEEGRR